MLLIDTLLESHDGKGKTETTLRSDCIASDALGKLTPLILVELIAQTYAAVKGWEIVQSGQEFPIGYLVGVQKFEAVAPAAVDTRLEITVETVGEFEGFAVVEGIVSAQGETIAAGKIKLWVPEGEE